MRRSIDGCWLYFASRAGGEAAVSDPQKAETVKRGTSKLGGSNFAGRGGGWGWGTCKLC